MTRSRIPMSNSAAFKYNFAISARATRARVCLNAPNDSPALALARTCPVTAIEISAQSPLIPEFRSLLAF